MKHLVMQLLAVALLVSGYMAYADGPVLAGTVIRVVDGDTIDVQLTSGRVRVRMNGVDTPERGQPWGERCEGGSHKARYVEGGPSRTC